MAVNVRDVAALAGVSVGTVSNVLNRPQKVADDTVARVNAAIAELGFVRNDVARSLRVGRSNSIGLVVLDIANPFFTDLARGAEERAAEDGLSVLLANSDENAERESAHLNLFAEQRVRGVLVSPVADASAMLAKLKDRGIAGVVVDSPGGDRFGSVSVDDVAGGYAAAAHLLEIGRRRIAFVGGSLQQRQVRERLEGASRAVGEHPGAQLEVVATRAPTVREGSAAGASLVARAPRDRPDAIFAANDLLAVGVLQALVMKGDIAVPEDIALIGYDDIAFAASTVVPLSSMRQPSHDLGRSAVDMLLRAGRGEPEHVVFQPELVVRASTVS